MVHCRALVCFIFSVELLFATTRALSSPGNLAGKVSLENVDVKGGNLDRVLDGQRFPRTSADCSLVQGTNPELHVLLTSAVRVSFVLIYVNVSSGDKEVSRNTSTLNQLEVIMGDDLCTEVNISNTTERLSAVCKTPILGERVIIRLPGENRALRICEVEVYDTTCDCLDGCHADQKEWCSASCPRGECINRENVALRKPTRSSPLDDTSGPPGVVVNGNTGITFISKKAAPYLLKTNCILTQSLSASLWWSVDLKREVPVRSVVIYRSNPERVVRTETVTEVTVDGERCATYGPETPSAEDAVKERLVIECDHVIRGREVKIARIRVFKSRQPAPLQLCEVEVWSCKPGWFGPGCLSKCGYCRAGRSTCDAETGHCPVGCQAGWYGQACMSKCPERCLDNLCHQDSGHCLKCPDNTVLPNCTETTNDGDSGSGNAGVVAGAVVGVVLLVIIVLVIVFVICYRRRRGGLRTQQKPVTVSAAKQPAGPVVYSRNGKPEVTKVDSSPYTEAASSNNTSCTDVTTNDADSVYEIIGDIPCYESLKLDGPSYENTGRGTDKHDYTSPVFTRSDSQTSDGYVQMGAT